ncbi:hypothetical protein Tco_0153569 [Tanacetum coccineum]
MALQTDEERISTSLDEVDENILKAKIWSKRQLGGGGDGYDGNGGRGGGRGGGGVVVAAVTTVVKIGILLGSVPPMVAAAVK